MTDCLELCQELNALVANKTYDKHACSSNCSKSASCFRSCPYRCSQCCSRITEICGPRRAGSGWVNLPGPAWLWDGQNDQLTAFLDFVKTYCGRMEERVSHSGYTAADHLVLVIQWYYQVFYAAQVLIETRLREDRQENLETSIRVAGRPLLVSSLMDALVDMIAQFNQTLRRLKVEALDDMIAQFNEALERLKGRILAHHQQLGATDDRLTVIKASLDSCSVILWVTCPQPHLANILHSDTGSFL